MLLKHTHDKQFRTNQSNLITPLQNYFMPEIQDPFKAHTTPHSKVLGKKYLSCPQVIRQTNILTFATSISLKQDVSQNIENF